MVNGDWGARPGCRLVLGTLLHFATSCIMTRGGGRHDIERGTCFSLLLDFLRYRVYEGGSLIDFPFLACRLLRGVRGNDIR